MPTANLSEKLLKTYSDKPYQHTAMVTHKGTVIAFAMDNQQRIRYAVLNMSKMDQTKGEFDAAYWPENPQEIRFPNEITQVGYSVVDNTRMPTVKADTRQEAANPSQLLPNEVDHFLSTTARLTADAPFQVFSDNHHIFVFRQAIAANDPNAVNKLNSGGASGDPNRPDSDFQLSDGNKVAIVDRTLLCDRFILCGNILQPNREVRYQRSRHKTSPASQTDSLGAKDMEGNPFFEPTQELAFIRNLTAGGFTVLQLPTQVNGIKRWQFFAHNSATQRIDAFNLEVAGDGLFNPQGTQLYTSPDLFYRDAVLEREPGPDPFTGAALIPVTQATNHAETALGFDGSSNYVEVVLNPAWTPTAFTIEMWVRAAQQDLPESAGIFASSNSATTTGSFQIDSDGAGNWRFNHADGYFTIGAIALDWQHLVIGYDGTTLKGFLDGTEVLSQTLTLSAQFTHVRLGSNRNADNLFAGQIDEARVWGYARTGYEINSDRLRRLIGNEPGLVGYWRFDEGAGNRAFDQTDKGNYGTIYSKPEWVASDAPIGDHPGMRRSSFSFTDRTIVDSLSAKLYYQQEAVATGYDGSSKPMKKSARVMVAAATNSRSGGDPAVATLDFAVSREGRLPSTPDAIDLPVLEQPQASDDTAAISNLEGEIRTLTDDIEQLNQEIAVIQSDVDRIPPETSIKQNLEREIAALQSEKAFERANFKNHWCKLKLTCNQRYLVVEAEDAGWVYASLNDHVHGDRVYWRFAINNDGSFYIYNKGRAGILVRGEPCHVLQNRTDSSTVHSVSTNQIRIGTSLEYWRSWDGNKYGGLGQTTPYDNSILEVIQGDLWNTTRISEITNQISQKQTQLNAQTTLVNSLIAQQALLSTKQSLFLQKQNNLTDKQSQLSVLTGGEKQEIRLPMGLVHIDASGLTVNGSLIKFAPSTHTPTMLDGATGELTLYYPDDSGQFMAAYFQTLVARTRLQFAESGVTLLARSAGSNNMTATISDGRIIKTCTLVITNPDRGITETWTDLPRDPQLFTDILNGTGDQPSDVTATVSPSAYSVKERSPQVVALVTNNSTKITNGSATVTPGRDSLWIANTPGRAYYFSSNSDLLLLPSAKLAQTAMNSDLTVEAWVNPSDTNQGTSRLIHHCSDHAAYTLALQKATLDSSLRCNGTSDYVQVSYPSQLNPSQFTVSCWVKVTGGDNNYRCPVCSRGDDPQTGYIFYAGSNNNWQFWCGNESSSWQTLTGSDVQLNTWTHLAGTYDGQTMRFYVNGQLSDSQTTTFSPNTTYPLRIGAGNTETNPDYYFPGQIDAVAIWQRDRSQAEIQADMNRRLQGNETDLVAYYTFINGEANDRGPNGYHGTIHGSPTVTAAPDQLVTYVLIAGVSHGTPGNHQGQRWLKSKETLTPEQWHHIALCFRQSHGLSFNGQSHLDCGNNQMLDIGEDLTIEAFIQFNNRGSSQGIIGKGFFDQQDKSVPYQLKVAGDGTLEFTFEDADGGNHTYYSTQALTAGTFYRVAVTRKKGTTQHQEEGDQTITIDGQNKTIKAIKSVTVDEWFDITFYINGVKRGVDRYDGEAPLGNDQPLEIGRCQSSPRQISYFQGTISEVRLWNKARDEKDIGKNIQGGESGLVSWWQFEENEGNVAIDSKSNNHGKIKGARWVRNPDPKGSPFYLLLNGLPLAAHALKLGTPNWGDDQFSMAGYKLNGVSQDCFQGILEEVRIWRTLRTDEQIGDNLFTRLKGEKQDLLAYYTFDDDSSRSDATQLNDNSLRGNHLSVLSGDSKPLIFLSTAPISNDTAAVRSALASVSTDFHEQIDSTPSVVEYADLQRDNQGNLGGVLKRCYSYLQNGQWCLVTGYKVGNLVTEWIGQAQFDPQVIGYIEGVPPVPSENLTDGNVSFRYDNIGNVSNIEVVESETVTYTLSTSKEESFDLGFKGAGSYSSGSDDLLITAPLGIGTAKKLVEAEVNVGVEGTFDTSNSWSQEESLGTSINRTRTMSVALGGSPEGASPEQQLNPAVGRRIQPGNMGFALVQSQTADIFALRLAHNNALVSFRMLPNPDIPIDWNIIPFQMNPRYTKQGTLDGRVGYDEQGAVVLDPDYVKARQYGEYSYYKPKEAYAIERRIQREEQRLLNYYQNSDTEIAETGQIIGAAAGAAAGLMAGPLGMAVGAGVGSIVGGFGDALSQGTSLELPQKFAKRNLVNTYVWTADGGFFAETTETTDVKSEVTAGSFSFSGAVGGSFSTDVEIFSIGFNLAFEASIGGGFSLTKTKAKDTEKSFSIEVNVDVPGDLQKTAPDANNEWKPVFDEHGNAVTAAGKVDAYRFKTFYLDSSDRNFEDLFGKVVDPIWLAGDSPNAVALRQAQQSDKKPPCWRVFHRVTFVSRILPDFPDLTEPPLEAVLKAQNIDSNWLLIQKLDPFVRSKTQDAVAFADAVRQALNTYLPELAPHSDQIIDYLKIYYGILD
ncbi:LamG domain-containing protein [Coleofasciculus sp. F4-SAH-05]|uniref:LamG domain-containing protein n=1 Tax=Coleofasciculus sp. F4-SAH-05 TaxID=3069525 RepID=UPI0033038E67